MRLIDADALKQKFTMVTKQYKPNAIMERPAILLEDVDKAPTIDAVEVVRCKDCRYNWVTSYNHGVQDEPRCKFTSYNLSLNDYCSKGEKMNG